MLVALSAIILPFLLIVILRIPAKHSMPVSALGVALLATTVWGIDSLALAASALQGIHRAMTIIWILIGALFFLYVMQKTGAMDRIKQGLFRITTDMRVQLVLIGFAFVAIIEGVSGFGTPAAIAVPLLVALGFHPLSSVVLALIGDSVPTSFGALGTPLTVGLSNIPNKNGNLVNEVASRLVAMDSLYALILPIILVAVLVFAFGRKSQRKQDILEIAPWGLLMGLVYATTAFASQQIIGLEFASVIAGVATLLFGVITVKRGILQPKIAWRHHALEGDKNVVHEKPSINLLKAWLPYGLIIGGLMIQRLVPSVKEFSLQAVDFSWRNILSFGEISSIWQILYSPGTTLLLVGFVTMLMFRNRFATLKFATINTGRSALVAGIALVSTLIMVQIFTNSDINDNNFVSMPVYIAEAFALLFGPVWVVVSPFIGTIAAFIMGSSTVSTLTMSPVQYNVAMQLNLPVDIAMAQQVSGANAGNIIAIHNVVAASAVSGLHHQEWRAIRHTLPIVFVYLFCTIIMSIVLLEFT